MTATVAPEGVRLEAAKREIKSVNVKDMFVDTTYQRPLRAARIQQLKENFSWDALGVICLSQRTDDTFAVVDGQHRIELLRELNYGNDTIESEVFHGLTLAEEAALFRDRNFMEKVPLLDRFRARLVAGDEKAQDMMAILNRHGWSLHPNGSGEGAFAAVGRLEAIYNRDPMAAERAISTLTRAWGHDSAAVDSRLIDGFGRVFAKYGDQVDTSNLVDRLASFPGGPMAFLGQARGLQSLIGGTVAVAVAERLIDLYNMRRKKTALPPLRTPVRYEVSEVEED